MINYQFFPRSHGVTQDIKAIIDCFKQIEPQLEEENVHRTSNEVLALVRPHLEAIGFAVETGKGKEEKIDVPVLFGECTAEPTPLCLQCGICMKKVSKNGTQFKKYLYLRSRANK